MRALRLWIPQRRTLPADRRAVGVLAEQVHAENGRRFDVIALAGIGSVFFVALKLHQYANFAVAAELAEFEMRLWTTLRGDLLADAPGGPSFLAQHFSPILLLLAPIYALFASPVTLLVVQGLAAALAVVPLYFLTLKVLGSRWAAVCLGAAYLLSRVVNYGLMYDFHMEIFYPLLFFAAFLELEKRHWRRLFPLLVLAATVKEDAPIAIAGLGLYALATGAPRPGVAIVLGAIAWFGASVLWIIPAFRSHAVDSSYPFVTYWSGYGSTLPEVCRNMLDPRVHFHVLFTPHKLTKTFDLLSGFVFLPFASLPGLLFLVLPNWFVLYSSDNRLMNGPILYYGLLITPFLFYATMIGLRALAKRWPDWRQRIILGGAILMLLVHFGNSRIFKLAHPSEWRVDPRWAAAQALVQRIPRDAPVAAQVNLIAHVPVRPKRTLIPRGIDGASYVLLDTAGSDWPLHPEEHRALVANLRGSGEWVVDMEADGFLLLQRR